jgi:hypothetical protein
VVVADPIPAGLVLIAAAPSHGSFNAASGVWTVGTLANGATAVLQITAQTTAVGRIANNAEARADQFETDMPGSQATVDVTVLLSAEQISKADYLASTIQGMDPAQGPSLVQVRRDSDGALLTEFAPYGPGYSGPISVAVGDILGDGIPDLVTAAGVGNPVRVYDGRAFQNGTFDPASPNASLLAQWFAYGLNFNVGATVAVGDIEHDGFADIVTGATAGNPDVKVYSGKDIAMHTFDPNGSSVVAEWFAYGLQFNLGANVAVGDVSGNGDADVITGATAGNPHVKVYSDKDIALHTFAPNGSSVVAQWFAFGQQFNIGANVAVADVKGDGFADVIVGASSGNSQVQGTATGMLPPVVNGFDFVAPDLASQAFMDL